MPYNRAAEILSDAALQLGLKSAPMAEPFAETDQAIVQLRALLKSAGRDLVRRYQWAHLRLQYTFTTTTGVDTYTLPGDFARWVDQTAWNRSSSLPLGGPVSPQGWQMLKTLNVIASVQLFFRTKGSNLTLHPVPAQALDLALEYLSGWWVQADGESAPSGDEPTDNDDLLLLDSQLLVHRLKRDFQQAKGLDSTASSDAYEDALALAQGADSAAPVLSLNGPSYNRTRLLNGGNVPPSGYGS